MGVAGINTCHLPVHAFYQNEIPVTGWFYFGVCIDRVCKIHRALYYFFDVCTIRTCYDSFFII